MPFLNGMNMRDFCLQNHPPLDKVKQSATKADFTIHGRKAKKVVRIFNTESISNIEKSQPYGNLNGGNIIQELNVNINFCSLSKVNEEKAVHCRGQKYFNIALALQDE